MVLIDSPVDLDKAMHTIIFTPEDFIVPKKRSRRFSTKLKGKVKRKVCDKI